MINLYNYEIIGWTIIPSMSAGNSREGKGNWLRLMRVYSLSRMYCRRFW